MGIYTEKTIYRSHDVKVVTTFDSVHPDLPVYLTENYVVCAKLWHQINYCSKLVLYYNKRENKMKQYFAQILSKGVDNHHHYFVAFSSGEMGKVEVSFDAFVRYQEAYQKYKSIFADIYKALKKQEIYLKVQLPALYSFHPLEGPQDTIPSDVVSTEYTKYQHFDDVVMTPLVKLLVPEFAASETMKLMKGDVNRSVVAFPTADALVRAKQLLSELDEHFRHASRTISISDISNEFRLLIPCRGGEHDETPMIDSAAKVREREQLLACLGKQQGSDQLTLPYPEKVDLFLSRLKYPLVALDQNTKFVQAVRDCILHTGVTIAQPHSLSLINVFAFDTSPSRSSSNNMLLWYGTRCSNVYMHLKSGYPLSMDSGTDDECDAIGFYDVVSKPVTHCKENDQSVSEIILLLNEVQMGDSREYQSITTLGSMQSRPHKCIVDDFGSTFYHGRLRVNPSVTIFDTPFNEYKVFENSKVKIRYLVHVKIYQ